MAFSKFSHDKQEEADKHTNQKKIKKKRKVPRGIWGGSRRAKKKVQKQKIFVKGGSEMEKLYIMCIGLWKNVTPTKTCI